MFTKGRHQNRKSRKFGTMSQLGLTPPPLRPLGHFWISDIFEKCWTPPPLTKLGHFWISDISYKGNIANYTIKWLRLGHFWKIETPPSVFKIPKLKLGHFCLSPPLPLLGHCRKFSRFSILMPPLIRFWPNSKGSFQGSSITINNCQIDICPGNIWHDNIVKTQP